MVRAIIDMGTNTLTVNVEIYYTGSQTVTSNKINVAVLQNNIEGPQSGGLVIIHLCFSKWKLQSSLLDI